jgi:hypothetical protein
MGLQRSLVAILASASAVRASYAPILTYNVVKHRNGILEAGIVTSRVTEGSESVTAGSRQAIPPPPPGPPMWRVLVSTLLCAGRLSAPRANVETANPTEEAVFFTEPEPSLSTVRSRIPHCTCIRHHTALLKQGETHLGRARVEPGASLAFDEGGHDDANVAGVIVGPTRSETICVLLTRVPRQHRSMRRLKERRHSRRERAGRVEAKQERVPVPIRKVSRRKCEGGSATHIPSLELRTEVPEDPTKPWG